MDVVCIMTTLSNNSKITTNRRDIDHNLKFNSKLSTIMKKQRSKSNVILMTVLMATVTVSQNSTIRSLGSI